MFLCEKCHDADYNCSHFTRSQGPCEGCKKLAVCYDCRGDSPKVSPKKPNHKERRDMKFLVEFTYQDLLELGLVGCANCVEATNGQWSHPPNNHFEHDKRPCAHCPCKEFKMKLRRGTQIIKPTQRKDGRPI